MPRMELHKAFARKINGLYKKTSMGISLIGNPIESYKALKSGAKMQKKKHAGRHALGKMVRARLVNGPELNIVLLGIPFLIDFGISYGMGKFKAPGSQYAARNNGGDRPARRLRLSPNPQLINSASERSVDVASQEPMEQAPFSDQLLPVYNVLRQAGMSDEGARAVVTEEYFGDDVADHLSEDDIRILANAIGTVLVPYLNEPDVAGAEASEYLGKLAS